ncbi:hypothetical protein [Mangrovihabitans endophyticus]|uniref:Uncharacterized protein n=1 Tax=Mangrovihabitans endophyticus TaxID=1751298 RepID=A0A8J3C8F3_9ACTN|nr:hypothetical protein [Mangrovihabitans endophyticus]GGL18190.1 hypothetical protein GCM10012284_60960 [Mangrovihabitans endophyticus]
MRIATGWSGLHADERPDLVVEAHMVAPGQIQVFALAGVSVVNLGTREAGLFLTAAGNIIASVPIATSPNPADVADSIVRDMPPKSNAPIGYSQLGLF